MTETDPAANGRRRSGWKSLRGSTVMSHDPPFGGDVTTGSLLIKSPMWSRASAGHPPRSRTSRVEGTPRWPCISRVTTQDEATSANPASQSQTSCSKTHSAYQHDRASPTTRSPDDGSEARGARRGGIHDGRLTLPLTATTYISAPVAAPHAGAATRSVGRGIPESVHAGARAFTLAGPNLTRRSTGLRRTVTMRSSSQRCGWWPDGEPVVFPGRSSS